MAAINDEEMEHVMITDLIEVYGFKKKRAKSIVKEFGDEILDAMWGEYSNILDQIVKEVNER